MNSSFAKPGPQGEVVVHFGGDPNQDNYLEIYPNWTATFRIYSPQKAYFNGQWKVPELKSAE